MKSVRYFLGTLLCLLVGVRIEAQTPVCPIRVENDRCTFVLDGKQPHALIIGSTANHPVSVNILQRASQEPVHLPPHINDSRDLSKLVAESRRLGRFRMEPEGY